MPYYNTCPDCGAHLDPGESCDCNALSEDDIIGYEEWLNTWTTEWRRFDSIFTVHYALPPEEQYIVYRTAVRLAMNGMTEEERALTATEPKKGEKTA